MSATRRSGVIQWNGSVRCGRQRSCDHLVWVRSQLRGHTPRIARPTPPDLIVIRHGFIGIDVSWWLTEERKREKNKAQQRLPSDLGTHPGHEREKWLPVVHVQETLRI